MRGFFFRMRGALRALVAPTIGAGALAHRPAIVAASCIADVFSGVGSTSQFQGEFRMKSRWMLAVGVCVCSLTAYARFETQIDAESMRLHEVQVQVQPELSFVPATEDVRINLTIANNGRDAVTLTKWFVPGEDFDEPLFAVTRDGVPVEYMGPIVKRLPPTTDDLIVLQPGESLTVPVELSGTYDFSAGGEYAISYRTRSSHLFGPGQREVATLASPAVSIAVESRAYSNVHALAGDGHKAAGGGGVSYTGRCSASQQTTLLQAVSAATAMADEAKAYLSKRASATPRYTTWFGAFSTAGWSTAQDHFTMIDDAFNTKPLTLDCGCKKKYYAYVYPTQPYKIYVCSVFWQAPMTGTDSKGGTLIHEMSHFNVVAGTDDWAYGQTAAKNLAATDPVRALNNADNHEYFAENTPPLQ
jgi:peptidyl-Lys metalloendopeptidase